MLKKQFVAEFKALTSAEGAKQPGEFEAVVAVYNNVDAAGDRIKSGAFDETLAAWKKSGDPIPIILAHEWNDPWAHIGYANPEDVESIPGRGLHVKRGVLDVQDNPMAKQVYRLMQRRTLKEFSFGYRVPQGGERKAQDGAFDLLKLDLIEFGPCLKGVNPATELLAIKSELEAQTRRDRGEEPTMEERLTRLEAAFEGKADVPVTTAPGDAPETVEADSVRILNSMIGQAREFIGNEEDPEEAAVMAEILANLEELLGEEVDEPNEDPAAEGVATTSKSEPEPDIELMLREQAIEALEVECREVLVKDYRLDDATRTMEAYDRLLED